jgi:orotidine-5'-phosphate decarboxylase
MKNKTIVALDFSSADEVKSFISKVGSEISWVKVGMELFYKEGSSMVHLLKDKGYKVFLDLKLHDIPNTVERAAKNLLALNVDMLNFHVAGGSKMLQQVAKLDRGNTLFIGVTQLTSTSEEQMQKELWIEKPLLDVVLKYTKLSVESGLQGVVCSPHEVRKIKEFYPKCVTVCPGVRLESAKTHDQVRVATPSEAIQMGADYLVIGRNITEAKDPRKAIHEIYQNMERK